MKSLTNSYYVMRHGESEANQKGIIVSNPDIGTRQYGLTEMGNNQVRNAVLHSVLKKDTVIFTSDFKRAVESACIAAELLSTEAIHYSELLRERYFGNYDLKSHDWYHKVWEKDKTDADNQDSGVESPAQVWHRIQRLFTVVEDLYQKKSILLVSHGDILQILLTGCQGLALSQHRSIDHLHTAEVRPVRLAK